MLWNVNAVNSTVPTQHPGGTVLGGYSWNLSTPVPTPLQDQITQEPIVNFEVDVPDGEAGIFTLTVTAIDGNGSAIGATDTVSFPIPPTATLQTIGAGGTVVTVTQVPIVNPLRAKAKK